MNNEFIYLIRDDEDLIINLSQLHYISRTRVDNPEVNDPLNFGAKAEHYYEIKFSEGIPCYLTDEEGYQLLQLLKDRIHQGSE